MVPLCIIFWGTVNLFSRVLLYPFYIFLYPSPLHFLVQTNFFFSHYWPFIFSLQVFSPTFGLLRPFVIISLCVSAQKKETTWLLEFLFQNSDDWYQLTATMWTDSLSLQPHTGPLCPHCLQYWPPFVTLYTEISSTSGPSHMTLRVWITLFSSLCLCISASMSPIQRDLLQHPPSHIY